MKKAILIQLASIMSVGAIAQGNAIDKYFSDYKEDGDVAKVHVTRKAFELMDYVETNDEETKLAKDLILSFDEMNMIMSEEKENGKEIYERSIDRLGSEFEELMQMEEHGGKLTFFVDEENGTVRELLLVAFEKDGYAIMSITGEIDIKKLTKAASLKSMGTIPYVQKLPEEIDGVEVVPNAVKIGSNAKVKLPESMGNSNVTVYDMQGRIALKQNNLRDNSMLTTSKLGAGAYVMHVVRDGVVVRKKFTVVQ